MSYSPVKLPDLTLQEEEVFLSTYLILLEIVPNMTLWNDNK
jgi:hypothetical protein